MKNLTERKKNTSIVVIVNLILTIIFYRAHYWTSNTTFTIKLRTYIVCLILMIVVPLLSYYIESLNAYISVLKEKLNELINKVKSIQKKAIIDTIIQYGVGAVFAWGMGHLAAYLLHLKLSNWDYNIMVFWCCVTASNVIITCWKFRKCAKEKFDKFFFCIALIVGTFFCTFTPAETGITWDDEIHYVNAVNMANYFNGESFKADDLMVITYQRTAGEHYGYEQEEREIRKEALNESYDKKELGYHYSEDYAVSYVGYTPYVVGILLGRGFNLSYTATFRLARYLNLLFYITLVTLAIRKLRTGKLILAFIALLPTAFYMAGSYSYDPWIIALSMYGYATFFSILQSDKKVETMTLVKMLVSLVLAFMVKAVYFPALFPLLFIPKNRFQSKRQHRIYIVFVFASAIFLLSTFLLPMLIGSNDLSSGDDRGGDGVNPGGQINYILSNPYQFTKMMAAFLFNTYLSPGNAFHWQQNYAYMSLVYKPPFYMITQFLFYIVCMYDQDGERRATKWTRITGIFGIFCAIFLTALALYISYTPVGYETVNGCQFRYLLPFVFPVAYLLGFNFKVDEGKLENWFYIIPILIIVATFVFWTGGNLYAGWSRFLFK